MNTSLREMPELELALLRRGLDEMAADFERCGHCHRSLLIGERLYEYASGKALCALCADRERTVPAQSHTVHGPAFGHSIRVIDRRDRTANAA